MIYRNESFLLFVENVAAKRRWKRDTLRIYRALSRLFLFDFISWIHRCLQVHVLVEYCKILTALQCIADSFLLDAFIVGKQAFPRECYKGITKRYLIADRYLRYSSATMMDRN